MAAIVTIAMIPVLYSVARNKAAYYVGRTLWFGLLSMYSMVMYVIQIPWQQIYEEFNCHGNITYLCLMECFEQIFSIPIIGIWYYFYFIFLGAFFLMEFFMAQFRHKHIKVKVTSPQKRENAGEMEKGPSPMTPILNFHQEKTLLYLYLFHLLLQVSIQIAFLCLLIFKHLPIVSQGNIHCSPNSCPGPFRCLIRRTSQKRMTIYTLITFSTMIILLGTGSFVYGIHHYLLTARSTSKV